MTIDFSFRALALSAAPILALSAIATPAKAERPIHMTDWYGAQVVIGGSDTQGGWMHATTSYSRGGEYWAASGSANMDDGALKAVATTGARGPKGCHPWFCDYRTSAVASAWDVIELINTTDELQIINYSFEANGVASKGDWGGAGGFTRHYFGGVESKWFTAEQIDITHAPYSMAAQLRLEPGQRQLFYSFAAIGASASDGGNADFGHTMRFNWTLPDGVTYESASGSFMAGAGVPEPTTWAMMLMGFGLIGYAARRRATQVHFA